MGVPMASRGRQPRRCSPVSTCGVLTAGHGRAARGRVHDRRAGRQGGVLPPVSTPRRARRRGSFGSSAGVQLFVGFELQRDLVPTAHRDWYVLYVTALAMRHLPRCSCWTRWSYRHALAAGLTVTGYPLAGNWRRAACSSDISVGSSASFEA
ncbi:protein of unknown function [Micropruina glycogenica]|uniref:Uncharacterized protein n=1 Tax=Micropruina glycogenica TaxID=75385 RepID=A0A2N9JIT6_9ACTN|nr:protein of unknown function [Micropruina glycogenica]